MGVSGCGKSTLGRELARVLGWPFAEGDDFHPPANLARMGSGTPLTDAERWPWLRALRDWMTTQARAGHSTVLSCSALRACYRDLLRGAEGEVLFVYLPVPPPVLRQRLAGRKGHFMPAHLLDSQLATLETPSREPGVLTLRPEASVEEWAAQVRRTMT